MNRFGWIVGDEDGGHVEFDYSKMIQAFDEGWTVIEITPTSQVLKLQETLDAVSHILSDEWVSGRVLPRVVGAEDVARISAIKRVMGIDD